jgi:hypothetical protein
MAQALLVSLGLKELPESSVLTYLFMMQEKKKKN